MQLSANELAIINIAINNTPIYEADQSSAKELLDLILKSVVEEGQQKHFIDGDIELSTLQKSFLIKSVRALPWIKAQWEAKDSLLSKIK